MTLDTTTASAVAAASTESRWRRHAWQYGPAVTIVVVALGLWELLIRVLDVPRFLWPAPSLIVATLRDDAGPLAGHSWTTLREVLLGFLIALTAGLVIGVLLHLSETLRRGVLPILIASQSVPTVVLAPVLVLVMGFNIGPILAVIALFCFFPIAVNTIDGLSSVDREYVRMMQTLDASRRSIFRRVEFPSALPFIFTGTRIGATYAAIGAVFGEWAGSDGGLGWLMIQAKGRLDTPLVFAAVAIITSMAVSLFLLVALVERLTIPWARSRGGRMK
ncbi:MAG: ABC transporter permease [Thermoleophilia bacterium]|nr:ABC transporter permease [Thermoleophilia bacterium]